MKSFLQTVAVTLIGMSGLAFAADDMRSTTTTAEHPDAVVKAARAAIAQQDWVTAQKLLRDALQEHAGTADRHNLYAYAMRKAPNPDMPGVLAEYTQALQLNPQHTGAHEYIGEAYLQLHSPAKAKEHLTALMTLCTAGCKELDNLKAAIAQYEAKSGGAPSTSY